MDEKYALYHHGLFLSWISPSISYYMKMHNLSNKCNQTNKKLYMLRINRLLLFFARQNRGAGKMRVQLLEICEDLLIGLFSFWNKCPCLILSNFSISKNKTYTHLR